MYGRFQVGPMMPRGDGLSTPNHCKKSQPRLAEKKQMFAYFFVLEIRFEDFFHGWLEYSFEVFPLGKKNTIFPMEKQFFFHWKNIRRAAVRETGVPLGIMGDQFTAPVHHRDQLVPHYA